MKKFIFSIIVFFLITGLKFQNLNHLQMKKDLPPIIDIEVFFGDPEISGAQISPDGKYISFRKPYNDVMNIWVKGIDEPFENAKPITAETKRPVTSYFWSRDSKLILYVQDFGGDENFRVYSVDPNGKRDDKTGVPVPKDLTPIEKVRVYILGVPKNDPEHIIVGINDRDPQYHDLYKVNIKTAERTLIIKNEDKVLAYLVDDFGIPRAALRQKDDGGEELLKIKDGKLERIFDVNFEETIDFQGFSEDPNFAYISTNKGENIDLTRLIKMNLTNGEYEIIESDPENEVDFGGVMLSEKTHKPIVTFYISDYVRYYFKDKQWEESINNALDKLPKGQWSITSMTEDESKIIIYISRDVDPGSAYLYDRITGELKFLYKSRPNLPTEYLAEMKPLKYKARDGLTIPAYLVTPLGVEPKNLPTVIFPHGGPWARDVWGYNAFAQFLANRGYAVLIPNFRGSTGYGKRFLNLGNKQWGTGTMQHDITDGVSYLIENGISDPKRVAIMGGSYGGYATLAGLAFTPDLYAAGVSIVGPSNLLTLIKSIPPYWVPMMKIFDIRVGSLNNPDDVERLKKQSPLFYAQNIKAPLLVIQGANDPRVKQAESDQIVATLRDLGRQVEYLLAKDEGHGFLGKLNRLAMIAKIDKFLELHLGGRSQEKYSPQIQNKLDELVVDIKTVKLPENTEIEIELAKKSSLPIIQKEKFSEGKFNYNLSTKIMGQDFKFSLERTIKINSDNKPEIVDLTIMPMGQVTVIYSLDKENLLPITVITKQGNSEISSLNFLSDKITGYTQTNNLKNDVNLNIEKPVMCDGGYLDVILGLIKYGDKPIYLTVYNSSTNSLKYLKAEFIINEDVVIEDRTYRCVKIQLTNLEDNSKEFYWYNELNPIQLVRSETKLPAELGGGILTTELKK
ncbi:MAG: S9 family peptidase [Ignavibacteria bacterium]|nr:S9 family peptidase [Ignavibacteria bacterium]